MAPYRQNQCKVTENFWPGQMKDLPHGIPAKLILVKMVEPQSLTFFSKKYLQYNTRHKPYIKFVPGQQLLFIG